MRVRRSQSSLGTTRSQNTLPQLTVHPNRPTTHSFSSQIHHIDSPIKAQSLAQDHFGNLRGRAAQAVAGVEVQARQIAQALAL